jgi:hypothetical protein
MPIRINLLAEAQSLEELRRKDPVKRAIWVGVTLVAAVMAWSSSLGLKAMMAKRELGQIEGQLLSRSNEFHAVMESQQKLGEFTSRLTALRELATNRFLHGSLLNALQQATIDDVQLVRLKTDQMYLFTDEIRAKTNSNDQYVPGKPAKVSERIVVTLDAKDGGATPGDSVNKFKQSIADLPYFQNGLGKTNEVRLTSLSPPQTTLDTKPYVLFTLECRYPERIR